MTITYVSSGQTLSGAVDTNSNAIVVRLGGTIQDTTKQLRAQVSVYGSALESLIGGHEVVYDGGVDSGSTISGGGVQIVTGVVSAAAIEAGGGIARRRPCRRGICGAASGR